MSGPVSESSIGNGKGASIGKYPFTLKARSCRGYKRELISKRR